MLKLLQFALIGVAIGILIAPGKGSSTRKKLLNGLSDYKDDAQDFLSDAADEVSSTAEDFTDSVKSKSKNFKRNIRKA